MQVLWHLLSSECALLNRKSSFAASHKCGSAAGSPTSLARLCRRRGIRVNYQHLRITSGEPTEMHAPCVRSHGNKPVILHRSCSRSTHPAFSDFRQCMGGILCEKRTHWTPVHDHEATTRRVPIVALYRSSPAKKMYRLSSGSVLLARSRPRPINTRSRVRLHRIDQSCRDTLTSAGLARAA